MNTKEAHDAINTLCDHICGFHPGPHLHRFIEEQQAVIQGLLAQTIAPTPWMSPTEFEKDAQDGWCWIAYKGVVHEAFYESPSRMYRHSRYGIAAYLSECITHVQPWCMPEHPNHHHWPDGLEG